MQKAWEAYSPSEAPTSNPRAILTAPRHGSALRAVFNYAIDNEFTSNYPFRRFKLRYTPTRKRALSVEQLRKVIGAPVPQWCEQYRDMWVLMFMLRGINIVDLCGLKRIDGDGCVTYIRAKTHRLYSIKVEPEARAIIERHRGQSFLLDMLDTHKDYRSYYRQMRRGLKAVLDALNGIDDGVHIDELTTYWSRHSWATIASRIDVPKDVIAAGLGHAQNSVTDIYIDFDDSKVDAANRRVLDYVLYNKM